MEMTVLDEELKTAMRLLGTRNIEGLGSQYVSTYQYILEAILFEYRATDICHLLAKYASIATPNLRRPIHTRETVHGNVGEALKHKHQYTTIWIWTS